MKKIELKSGNCIFVPDDCTVAAAVIHGKGADLILSGDSDRIRPGILHLYAASMKNENDDLHKVAMLGTLRHVLTEAGALPAGLEWKIEYKGVEVPTNPGEALADLLIEMLEGFIKKDH